MEKSHLWETLCALSESDWRALDKFVGSAAFNRRDHVVRLWTFLHEHLRRRAPAPPLEEAYAAAYPAKARVDLLALRNSMTLLLAVVEDYVLVRASRGDERQRGLQLARTWRMLGLSRQFERQLRQLKAQQDAAAYRNADFYRLQYEIEQEQYYAESAQSRMTGFNLQAVSDNLDHFYLAQKLRQACLALSHQAVLPTHYDLGLWPELRPAVESGRYDAIPAIAIYYACYRALTEPDNDGHFHHFKHLLLAHAAAFPADERRELLLFATNYCIRRLNTGARAYTREALELYRESLRDDVALLNGVMSRYTYRNIVSMAIAEHELDWADDFLHRYRDRLDPQHREPAYAFNLARLEYARHRYDRALPLLQNAEYSDPLLHLSAKTLLIKVFYALDQYDALHAQIDALQNFLRRHKELGYQRENYRQTLRFLQKLLKLRPGDAAGRTRLVAEIEATTTLAEREWLLERLRDGS
jgi:hypothetical protein